MTQEGEQFPDIEPPALTNEEVNREAAELEDFKEKLFPYAHRYLLWVFKDLTPESWYQMWDAGRRVRAIRRSVGLSRRDLAEFINEDPVALVAFEGGIIPRQAIPPGFTQKLAAVLREKLDNLNQTNQ